MKIKTLLIPALLLLLTTACGEKQEEYDACFCAPIIEENGHSSAPVLGFYETYTSKNLGGFLINILDDRIHFQVDPIQVGDNEYAPINEFNQKFRVNINSENRFVDSPEIGYALGQDTARINEILAFHIEENWLEVEKIKFAWSKHSKTFYDVDGEYYTLYGLKLDAGDLPRISSEDIDSVQNYFDPQSKAHFISVMMNEAAKQEWVQMSFDNNRKYIAIASADKVLSAPMIHEPITSSETVISGGFSQTETQAFVDVFNCDKYKRELGRAAFDQEMAGCLEER